MADIIAVVSDSNANITATVSDPFGSSVSIAPASVPSNTVESLLDVDLQGLADGSLLIYNNNTAKWTASTLLSKQNVEAGEY